MCSGYDAHLTLSAVKPHHGKNSQSHYNHITMSHS